MCCTYLFAQFIYFASSHQYLFACCTNLIPSSWMLFITLQQCMCTDYRLLEKTENNKSNNLCMIALACISEMAWFDQAHNTTYLK